ncbi:KPN_02809 family neutral zinc metallopeptidase [Guggenheimella bovis]
MKWDDYRQSSNVEDRRGRGGGSPSGGRFPIPIGSGMGGMGLIIILVIFLLKSGLLGGLLAPPTENSGITNDGPSQEVADQLGKFSSSVLAMTEDVWNQVFEENGARYQAPKMVLFSGSTNSGCGYASAQVGPFYCPADNKVYLDTSFFAELQSRFGAKGDFAMAYVIAHEVGHHIQYLTGRTDEMQRWQQTMSKEEYNQMSVRLELQADYLAGVFAKRIEGKGVLEVGDIEEAMNAANAIGDDTIQKRSTGYVVPDSFTHGTSEQRMRWFMKGYNSGTFQGGDTFSIPYRDL